MARIVLATIGSLGDLHPVLALALGLRARGHNVALATSESYRERLAALDLPLRPLRPDLFAEGEHVVAEIMDGPRGSERLMRRRIFPALRAMHADLLRATADADLLAASELVYPAPILAATHGLRWVSFQFAPVSLYSLRDPAILPAPDAVRWIQRGRFMHRLVRDLGKVVAYPWWRPLREFRRELGLPPGGNPFFEGKYSPRLNLALFSPVLQPPQPDWPQPTVQTGFLFHDDAPGRLPDPVEAFLAAGEPPVIFTLGSAAVYVAGRFFAESRLAAERLGRRALLILGKNPRPADLAPSILAWDYLPYAQVFPRAAAVVHQGGVGTTAQALRAGRPMLIVPFAHDQFDNAARLVRLGAGRTLARRRYRADQVAAELAALLDHPDHARSAAALGEQVRAECGVAQACDALERALRS